MTLKILLLVHLFVVVAFWDGYRLGLKRGRAERLTPQTRIEIENPQPVPETHRERWDPNWRLN